MRYPLQFSALALLPAFFILASCASYEKVSIDRRVNIPDGMRLYERNKKEAAGKRPEGRKSVIVTSEKFIIRNRFSEPAYVIMNEGVAEALRGNYIEAEILFNQVIGSITDGTVENNLAVIYEITRRKKDALNFYTKAAVKSPDNPQIRSNLLSFINLNINEGK